MLAAGDTFRAAAVEQLQTWGERNNIPVIAQGTGADAASVIYDAMESARSRNIDLVIADTAGRLHTQSNLMNELIKIKRVMAKLDDSAPHEILLVMDAGFGQNGLVQAQQFHDALALTGLALTKLDGTAKGGILFAIAEKLGTPIRFIGVGESIEDLREFHAGEFVDALLDRE
jgi:fused signal recognition particle receptor